ncbi:MAG: hypothetical protein ABIA75_08055 [Candidatus Neomarinimicrobiota bacterium]
MKEINDLDGVIDKVHEIRDFFRFGGEIIPFLVELFKFLQEIIPLIAEANSSLQESTHKLPTASDKISQVSESTELATQTIMDKLDNISAKVTDFASDNGNAGQVDAIQNDIFDIINALQFQDITAQQLEHANRILLAIHEKFLHLFQSVKAMDTNSAFQKNLFERFIVAETVEKIENDRKDFQQKTADKARISGNFSQDDVDSLFG